ncbi:hypothetical protein JCM10207_003311 [Rhodosporidiobolus poonsookiae]
MAAPAWRQLSFFSSSPYPSTSPSAPPPPLVANPSLISSLHSNPALGDTGVVLLADLEGQVHLLNEQWEPERSWRAYEGGRVGWMETASWDSRKGRAVLITVGDDLSTPFPLLKVWLLTLPVLSPSSSSNPPEAHLTLLRSTPVNPTPSRPTPVSSLALSPSLSHIVLGLADGSVVAWKRVDELIETSLNELEDAAARAAAPPGAAGAGGKARGTSDKPRPFVVGQMGKLRVLWEGNKEPVTNVGVTASSPASGSQQTLFVLTTSQILSLSLPSAGSAKKVGHPAVLDEHGAAVGCAKVVRLGELGELGEGAGEKLVVARDEAIYVYGAEGREGCWAYEGPKSSIVALSPSFAALSAASSSATPTSTSRLPTPYLAILTPPQSVSLGSASATIRAHASSKPSPAPAPASPANGPADDKVGKVTLFDPENKFVAFSAPYGDSAAVHGGEAGVREVVEAWGAIWVLTESGKLHRLTEQPLANSLSVLYQRNLFTLAISLAQSRGLGHSEVAEIYRRYGDHLYGKADYEGAMGCYLKTVGVVQASYVIRKFLDAQRLTHLTSYLQELHSRNLANSDITTLLLNCYTKLGDSDALERFIHSSSTSSSSHPSSPSDGPEEPPFDLDTAIRVLRQASYFSHASWLAQRYRLHSDYLRIAIEDEGAHARALKYVRALAEGEKGPEGRDEAREAMARWAGVLLEAEPEATTDVLVEICCDVPEPPQVASEADEEQKEGVNGAAAKPKGRLAEVKESSAVPRRAGTTNGAAGYDVPDTSSVNGGGSIRSPSITGSATFPSEPSSASAPPADLPSPRSFFPHFLNHPRQFVVFLEAVLLRRFGKDVDALPDPQGAALPDPRVLGEEEELGGYGADAGEREEKVVWNTLLELYVSPAPSEGDEDDAERARLRSKALRVIRNRETVPYDETQALLVCTTRGFEDGFVALYEIGGMYEEVVRYWIDASLASPSSSHPSSRLIASLHRYGPSQPSLYPLVLRHLTSTADLLTRHQRDVLDLLDEVDDRGIMPPIKVVGVLSEGGVASIGLVREYLKRQLLREKEEIESDQALISSYRLESQKKLKEIRELSDPNAPRVFQVTRCSACGGQLETPMVHFMCKHSYHQRCLGENESQCPNCARTHGVVREIRRANEQLAGRHDLFLQEVRDSDDGFKTVAAAFGRGFMEGGGARA